MGRKLFLKHVADAAANPPGDITDVQNPEESVVAFQFNYSRNGHAQECNIRVLALDVDEYPDGNNYMVYTDDDQVDSRIPQTLEILTPLLLGKPVTEALRELSRGLTDALTQGLRTNPIALNDYDGEEDNDAAEEEEYDAEDFADGEEFDNEVFGLGNSQPTAYIPQLRSNNKTTETRTSSVPISKIRSDIKAAKQAGFRVGILGNISAGGVVCVSVRVSKLGISEEAMQAWSLSRKHYLVLLIRFQLGYRDLAQVKEDSSHAPKVEMKVGLCERYKPSSSDAFAAFNLLDKPKHGASQSEYPLEPLFIGRPLNELLRDRFAKIISFRESCGFNWPSSESFVNDIQGKALASFQHIMDRYDLPDDTSNKALPEIVRADSLDGKMVKDASLPLVAMQFVLRHFVRCTEFCLVCHCKVGATFEALKPYVCSRPLCLYQYMTLGFGPSIEWELLSQPYVVDLLISFCYAAARHGRLKEFPVGIDLKVPLLPHYTDSLQYYRPSYSTTTTPPEKTETPKEIVKLEGRIDFAKTELLFATNQQQETASFRIGDWLLVRSQDGGDDFHYRIEGAMFPTYQLSSPVRVTPLDAASKSTVEIASYSRGATPASKPSNLLLPGWTQMSCYAYTHSFDTLTKDQQQHSIMTMLETLPSVVEMQTWLESEQKTKDPNLKMWRSRISETALSLMRWIIASNRSCIMQVDRLAKDTQSAKITQAMDDRIGGMDDWMQFRFAQGAPDKEQRFVDCVKKEASEKKYPTLFAWHGSPLSNWHSIIRQGLRFDETLHGRAYGHGVYMANMASTSVGYTNIYAGSRDNSRWPQSLLQVSSAFSLNEVVNMPEKFVSSMPHYVVSDIDWIQTRYLFVKSSLVHTIGDKPSMQYEQDPKRLALNSRSEPITIPIAAVSKSRRPALAASASKAGDKKPKNLTTTDQATAEQQEDDANSLLSDEDDQNFLQSEDEALGGLSTDEDEFWEIPAPGTPPVSLPSRKRSLDLNQTDFVPGGLDVSNIKFLNPPKDATSSATKALMGWFKDALKVQDSTPMYKLGWYIDPDHINNIYQWIVELHSFDEKLPLAKDMKKAGINSIVLEMRFTNQFPFSPPFIRVVKPRFLPFTQGGGGHVTEGGAICMELLTNSGWSAVSTVELILLQVRLAIADEGRPARLMGASRVFGGKADSYGVGEAVAAYERACRAHGWRIPEGFSDFNAGDDGML